MTSTVNLSIYEQIKEKIASTVIVVGFDACIDHITKPIRKRNYNSVTYFDTLSDFAKFLSDKGEMSGSIEMEETACKYGGNNPITSYALGKAGAMVHSIGAYGNEYIDPIFKSISNYCTLHSFASPGECWAYEFSQNKIMNYINVKAQDLTYHKIIQCINNDSFDNILDIADMIILLNYSEQANVIDIWKGILYNNIDRLKDKKMFFDLSDCTRIASECICDAIKTMQLFSQVSRVYLSLNNNEFLRLYNIYVDSSINHEHWENADSIPNHLRDLNKILNFELIVLRTLEAFYAVTNDTVYKVNNIFEEAPFCLTGAGDTQNAGICIGLSCGLSVEQALMLGVLYGNYYIKNGQSGTLTEILSIN